MKIITHPTPEAMVSSEAAKQIVEVARREKACVETDFNGVIMRATPSDTPEGVLEHWSLAYEREHQRRARIAELERELAKLKAGA